MTFASSPFLETPRLRLRPYRADDFDGYARIWAEPEVVRFIGGAPITLEAAWARFLRHIGVWRRYFGFGFLALEDRASGAFVGEAGFRDCAARLPRPSRPAHNLHHPGRPRRFAAKLGFAPYAETTYRGDPVTMLERPRPACP